LLREEGNHEFSGEKSRSLRQSQRNSRLPGKSDQNDYDWQLGAGSSQRRRSQSVLVEKMAVLNIMSARL